MQARLALGLAATCGALAVALVSVDLAYTLTVAIDGQDADGTWTTYQRQPYDGSTERPLSLHGHECTGPDVRIVIHNDRPIGATRDVRIWYEADGRTTTLLDETVALDAGEVWTHPLTVPADAFPDENETDDRLYDPLVYVNVQVDDLGLSQCASAEAPNGPRQEVPA